MNLTKKKGGELRCSERSSNMNPTKKGGGGELMCSERSSNMNPTKAGGGGGGGGVNSGYVVLLQTQ